MAKRTYMRHKQDIKVQGFVQAIQLVQAISGTSRRDRWGGMN